MDQPIQEDQSFNNQIKIFTDKPNLFYTKRFRKKKGKGVRVIHAPSPELKAIQRDFVDWFYKKNKSLFAKNPQITGFMPGKSIADNAKPHLDKDWVINLDIKDFFPSTNMSTVNAMAKGLNDNRNWFQKIWDKSSTGFKSTDIETLVSLLCLDGALPQGSPASPIIANYVGIKAIDDQVKSVIEARTKSLEIEDISYSRYADDLTISFNKGSRKAAKSIADAIENRINDGIYKIKESKTNIKHKSQRQLVTGVLVNGEDTKIDRRLMNKMRAIVHNTRKTGSEFSTETKGMLSFIQSINKEQYNKLIK